MRRILHISVNGKNGKVAAISTKTTKSNLVAVSPHNKTALQTRRVHCGDKQQPLSAEAIVKDQDIDLKQIGRYIGDVSPAYTAPASDQIVGNFTIQQRTLLPDGALKEVKPYAPSSSNLNALHPLQVQPKIKMGIAEAYRKFAFSRQIQLVHEDGVQYEFLYQLAKELAQNKCVYYVGAGKSGKERIVVTDSGSSYNGFLYGEVQGDQYVLLLLLTNMEVKLPPQPVA